ncbi:hypothetical protein [Paracidovorax avenae]|uniref:hypothetical protein n=1 Tax=Paracidovorax avenae TaxID=80867 RepID=UPI00126018F0|nr:hypothetical protein [Paracidovorax avenae]
MKRLLYALCGAFAAGTLSYAIADVFTHWYGPRFIRSDSDINDAYMGCLIFMAISVVLGAVMGYRRAREKTAPSGG